MNWTEKTMISLLAHLYLFINITPSYASSKDLLDGGTFDEDSTSTEDYSVENYIKLLSSILMKPWAYGENPVVYIENEINHISSNQETEVFKESNVLSQDKRSKYYRKFPLKRQNKYLRYDAENRYMCLPSREEVFKLLVALHHTKQGKRAQRINFCNRKRLAGALYSNVRFIGK